MQQLVERVGLLLLEAALVDAGLSREDSLHLRGLSAQYRGELFLIRVEREVEDLVGLRNGLLREAV